MRKLKDVCTVAYVMHEQNRVEEGDYLRYILNRRDELGDKIRFGLAAVNGASLIALLGMASSDGNLPRSLGFSPTNMLWSASGFAVGLILAGYSITRNFNVLVKEASDSFSRSRKISHVVALYEGDDSPENFSKAQGAFEEYAAAELTGFRYSNRLIAAQNFSAGCWGFGILLPLITALDPQMHMAASAIRAWLM